MTTSPLAARQIVQDLVQAGHLSRTEAEAALTHSMMELPPEWAEQESVDR